jgi:NAD(P)-dependent dehydrogenase (short-subunit alcohol dehydrogenase family)
MDALLDDVLAPDLTARYLAACGADPDSGATYRLAKRAVIRLCARAAVTWGARGGRVVSVSPGLIDTEMGRLELVHNPIKEWMAEITPVGAGRSDDGTVLPGRADDIASAVAFVCSDAAAFVSGCDLRVDGGLVAAMDQQAKG